MSKINISYKWDKQNVINLFEQSYKYQFNNSAKKWIGLFIIALTQFGVVAALKMGAFELLIFSTVLLVYWYYGKKYIARKRALNSFESSKFKNQDINLSVDKDAIEITTTNQQIPWSDIIEVMKLDKDIIIYTDSNIHYIPSDGFKSKDDFDRFLSLAKERLKVS